MPQPAWVGGPRGEWAAIPWGNWPEGADVVTVTEYSMFRGHEGRPDRSDGERGFSMVELMVVVLIIAVLLAIAIPTFMATRHKADDRAAQAGARQGLSAELSYYSDGKAFTDDPAILMVDTPLYRYVAAASVGPREISLHVVDAAHQRVILGVRSDTGTCFYVDHDMAAAVTRYGEAAVPACDPDGAPVGSWLPHW